MKKIMFSDEYGLTEAVLDGSKRMTRRICKVQRPSDEWRIVLPIIEQLINPECLPNAYAWRNDKTEEYTDWCVPRYKDGEIVAVAQSYETICKIYNGAVCKGCPLLPNETPSDYGCNNSAGWNNKMFVKAGLMPHQIQITDIRLKRLQDISDEDCIAEGIYKGQCGSIDTHFMDAYYFKGNIQPYCTPREAFAALIDKVSGKGTWLKNPYVFCYSFKLID